MSESFTPLSPLQREFEPFSPDLRLLLKWTLLVAINAVVPALVAWSIYLRRAPLLLSAVLAGVMIIILAYWGLDRWLQKRGLSRLRRWLLWAVALRSLTQFFPVADLMIGLVAIRGLEYISQEMLSSWDATLGGIFLAVLVDGALSSLMVGALMAAIAGIDALVRRWRTTRVQA